MSSYFLYVSAARRNVELNDTIQEKIRQACDITNRKPNSERNGYAFSLVGRHSPETVIVRLASRRALESPGRCISSITRSLIPLLTPQEKAAIVYNSNYLRCDAKDEPKELNLLDYQVLQIVTEILLSNPSSKEEKELNAEAANKIREIAAEYKARH